MADQQELINSMELQGSQEYKKSQFFTDGRKRIDYVLVYEEKPGDDDDEDEREKKLQRETFIKNLIAKGLDVEEAVSDKDPVIHYVKIHGGFDLLCDVAEDVKMKMPIQENDIDIKPWFQKMFHAFYGWYRKHDLHVVRDKTCKPEPSYFVATFDKDQMNDFLGHEDPDTFFSPSERSRLVYYICQQTKYGKEDLDVGVVHLLHKGGLTAAYPLHDGSPMDNATDVPTNDRQRLQRDWARWGRIGKYQPIQAIKEYFGEKVALYFAWLGFYTAFLIPAALVGVICFLYGMGSTFSFIPIKETCKPKNESLLYMCPLCDKLCSYYLLSKTACLYARVTHFFDNEATLFFALFMSLWATFFLEFWKRKQISLAYEWHTMDFEEDEERPRPEYLAVATKLKRNPITNLMEPYLPATKRVPRLVAAFSVVIFFILLVIGGVTSVIIYRAAIYAFLLSQKNDMVRSRSKIVVAATAACVNLVMINVLKFVYQKIAILLTGWENPRTRTDYEDSFTIKMFWFQFVNTYASVFYVAFFKNEYFVGWPGNFKRFGSSSFRFEGCSAQGCFLELCVQLIIIMVGQQFIGNVTEIAIPMLLNLFKRKQHKEDYKSAVPQWEQDYELKEQDQLSLFWQYLEIVLQYGFVTMFVAAFPLAPLFALINNVVEIRLDAVNFIRYFRRPVSERAEDIGAWYGILATLTQLSVLVNAFVLAFTSDLIPRIVYTNVYSTDGTLRGYVNNSLSYFYVKDFSNASRPDNATANVPYTMPFCRYPGYHEDHSPYKFDKQYWLILSARLAFIFIFQWVITVLKTGIAWAVPDVPKDLELKIKRENYLADEALKDHKENIGKRKPRQKGAPPEEKPPVDQAPRTALV